MFSIAFSKYAFLKKFEFPYFGLLLTSTPMAFIGFIILGIKIIRYSGYNKVLYLNGHNYLVIGKIHSKI